MPVSPPATLMRLLGKEHASIPELLRAQAEHQPEHIYLREGSAGWGFAEVLERAERFAGFARSLGLASDTERIATFLSKRREAYLARFGTLLAGSVHVALHREQRDLLLQDMLARSRAALLVTEAAAWEVLAPLEVRSLRHLLFVDAIPNAARDALPSTWRHVALHTPEGIQQTTPWAGVTPKPSDCASVLFTSGTTGRSKGVLMPHNQFVRGGARIAKAWGIGKADVFHDWMPLYHVGGQLHATMTALAAGACLALFPRFSTTRFWEQVGLSGATVALGFANMGAYLLAEPEHPEHTQNTLRVVLLGNATAELQNAFEHRFRVRVVDSYGMTEAEPLTLPVPGATPPGSCGPVSPDFEVAILDEADAPLPADAVGHVAVRPRAPFVMMQGYDGEPQATVESWRNLWFHTRDLGRLDAAGIFWFCGRERDALRRGGENISARDLERVLMIHPGIGDCAVVAVTPAPGAEAEIKAVVSPAEGASLDASEVHAFCTDRLARFMVPRYVEILTRLPYTQVGKIRREDLTELTPLTWDAYRQGTASS
jgi:crotonobetaine/carnitine-CoA ligase